MNEKYEKKFRKHVVELRKLIN